MTFRTLFGAAIVGVLLVLYVLLTRSAIELLDCTPQPGCLDAFTETMASALAIIGGLISAVVVAELALTDRDKPPFSRLLDAPTPGKLTILRVMTFLYLAVWLGVGLWVLVATWQKPDTIPALTALARSWFGLAVAAGYAFFGIKPNR